jgi:hypothetical protein
MLILLVVMVMPLVLAKVVVNGGEAKNVDDDDDDDDARSSIPNDLTALACNALAMGRVAFPLWWSIDRSISAMVTEG